MIRRYRVTFPPLNPRRHGARVVVGFVEIDEDDDKRILPVEAAATEQAWSGVLDLYGEPNGTIHDMRLDELGEDGETVIGRVIWKHGETPPKDVVALRVFGERSWLWAFDTVDV